MNLGIKDNIAVITGAGRGIGASCASLFSDENECKEIKFKTIKKTVETILRFKCLMSSID